MSHTIYAAKFEQTRIHQHAHSRRESQSHEPVLAPPPPPPPLEKWLGGKTTIGAL